MLGNYTFPDGRSDRDYNATQTNWGAGAVLGKMQLHLHNVLNKSQYDLLQAVTEDHQIFAWQQLSNTCSQPGDSCREFLRLFWEQDNWPIMARKKKINKS